MYKVLITDDEPTIREGLRTLIDWNGLGYEVVDTAANGKDALVKYDRHKPDLMIVDIRMPGMSGLELIEHLRKNEQTVHVLILSGYADFDYAKKAIALDTDGYLLKPVDEDELADYLNRLHVTLTRESAEKLKNELKEVWNRERVVQSYLTSGTQMPTVLQAQELADAELNWDSYSVVLLKLQGKEHEIEHGQLMKLKGLFVQEFEEKGVGVVFTLDSFIGLLVKKDLRIEQKRQALYKDITALLSQEDFVITAAAAGSSVSRLEEISSSYEEAAKYVSMRFFYAGDQLITAETAPIAESAPLIDASAEDNAIDCAETAGQLYFAIDIGNAKAIEEMVSEKGRWLLARGSSEQAIKAVLAEIVTSVISKLSQHDPDMQTRGGQLSASIHAIFEQTRYIEMEQHVIAFLQGLKPESSTVGTDKQIKKMLDLIQRNYVENLKLDTLAAVFNYNSAYLGKLFKNETGEYFNTYLDKVRVEKAKELLSQGMKVYLVAEKVGYSNVDYFHSKFRKYVGSSPSAYRKM
ncbi:response regulator transcription factor [Paenibacillus sp. CF384]|uniref:response regulator transcription factor n=1 Tax=Paenibacillus sp. CF384 TaxID=1884382 RepID=UPI00089AA0FA|nr:response regulator transcription factor [Paenibacillus sp. CF384]SDX15046.1 two-component system, response regulator YesN [Paenibacillus sp. CF384]